MGFDESSLEQLFIGLFEERGYDHILGETIRRPESEVLLTDDLIQYLNKMYGSDGISEKEIHKVVSFIHVSDRGDYVNNRETFEHIRNGFSIPRDDKRSTLFVKPIDFEKPDNTIFRIFNQLPIQ